MSLIRVFVFALLMVACFMNFNVWGIENDLAVRGLKEALNVGLKKAVDQVGIENGFFRNPGIKILLPEKLKKIDDFIKKTGGKQLSEALVKKMNRAAEKSAPKALDIFIKAIKDIKIEDGAAILNGGKNAATDFLREKTAGSLKDTFYPSVKETMEEINCIKTYGQYMGKIKSNPLFKLVDVDINRHVTDKSVEGLFKVVAEQEQKIREDPKAQATALLQNVFSGVMGK